MRFDFVLSFALFILFSTFPMGVVEARGAITPDTNAVERLLTTHSPKDVDGLLALLPESWRSQYLLVYGSRSLQSATLDRPRVILTTPDHQFFLAFADSSGPGANDGTIEMIENYGLDQPQFAEVSWEEGTPRLTRDPPVCMGCHHGANIFDDYPHWPGFFGSAHDGIAYGEKFGTSQIARFEFEERAIDKFKTEAGALPGYRRLLGLQKVTLSSLATRNTVTGAVMIAQLTERQNKQIYESLHSVSELNDAFMMSMPYREWDMSSATEYPEIVKEPRFAKYREFVARELGAYDEAELDAANDRLRRLKEFVDLYGTPNDRERMAAASTFTILEKYRPGYVPSPPARTDLGIPVAEVLNYFDDWDSFRRPGIFYRYWRSTHPEAEDLPYSVEFGGGEIRLMNGTSFDYLLTNVIVGKENVNPDGSRSGSRNYRSFEELYEWVPLPLKQYTWAQFAPYPALAAAVDKVQKAYLDVMEQSPLLTTNRRPIIFRNLKSWSPENRRRLERLITEPMP